MAALALLAATFAFTKPAYFPPEGSGGYLPIVEHQGEDVPPTPLPPNYPIPNTPPTPPAQQVGTVNLTSTYTYDLAIGSQGDFPDLSANYTLAIAVVTAKVNGVVTQTRPLNANEVVTGKFLNTSTRVAAIDPTYGNVKHGKLGKLKFTDMGGIPVQLTLKREFPVDPTNNTYKIDFIVP